MSLTLVEAPSRPAPLPPEVLGVIATGVARVEAWWRPHAHHDPDERRPVRLLATEAYEVWVIGWTAGQGVELHDHGDSAGALLVLEGELVELELDTVACTLARHVLLPGSIHPLPAGVVHDVVAATPVATTSIHVYSPPLAEMGRWDPVTLERVEVEAVVDEAPVLGPVASGRALHPSSGRRRA